MCVPASGHHREAHRELHLLCGRRQFEPRRTGTVEGELLIGGPGVALGYLKRPELTAEKFIANPFDDSGQDPVLYRSGDAVILGENGDIALSRPHRRSGQDPRLPCRTRRDRDPLAR
jgi:acyl-CoA synthetase (AMP-forming)/AMP-acid ligase II